MPLPNNQRPRRIQNQYQHPGAPSPPPGLPTKVPLATSSSIMVHSGFWQILQATGSRFVSGVAPAFVGGEVGFSDSSYGASGYGAHLPMPGGLGRPAVKGSMGQSTGEGGSKKGRRISVDMISNPVSFTHLVHASDAEQAEDLLRRWGPDGQGKLAEPAWALPIKEATRARARARGIAEVHATRDIGTLQVVNGLPSIISSTSSAAAVEGDPGSPASAYQDALDIVYEESQLPTKPPFAPMVRTNTGETIVIHGNDQPTTPGLLGVPGNRGQEKIVMEGTTRINQAKSRTPIDGMPGSPTTILPPSFDSLDPDAGNELEYALPKSFLPSLTTIEKAAATKVFFETHYHGILKRPRGRDQRKAMLEKELARLNISDAERRNVRAAWALSETEYLRDIRSKVGVGSFMKIKTIGHGAFGVVSLVKEKGSGQLYAMKQLRKADMLKKGQEGHVRAERDLLASASSETEWAVRLAYSFQDTDHLYLVMSFMSGGDLLSLLIEKDVFEESFAKFYMAEMVLAVEETHKVLGAIHRDIKPDNFLFDRQGHLAISDFGLATDFHWAHDSHYHDQQRRDLLYRHGIDITDGNLAPRTERFDQERHFSEEEPTTTKSLLGDRDRRRRRIAYSVVGTGNYMPVEVLRGGGYDSSCDWWSVGVILFEMLYGYPPFVSKSRLQTRQKIMNHRTSLRFPPRPRVSREAQDLITSLICEKEDRLGSRASASTSRPNSILVGQRRSGFLPRDNAMMDGANEIKAHPWFRGIDFANIHRQKPPFVPELKSDADCRYFDQDIDDNPLPPPEPVPGAPPVEETKDPMLKDAVHGPQILEVRKQLAFQGWTFKGQKNKVYDPRDGITNLGKIKGGARGRAGLEDIRGRPGSRIEGGSGFARSLSV